MESQSFGSLYRSCRLVAILCIPLLLFDDNKVTMARKPGSYYLMTLYLPSKNTIHTEKSFLNLVKSNQICIVITLFRLVWDQADLHLVSIQSEKCNYNPNLVEIKNTRKRFPSVCVLLNRHAL